ncbi:MAG TPA: pyruvate kinase [Methylomirabilota bacterium]|nr:pyruvate kinase [Methylomirabilota bacterium]
MTDPEANLLDQVLAVKSLIDAEEARNRSRLEAALPKHQLSARNLAHYLGLRRRDIRRLQLGLAAAGLSSLGRSEGHVRDTVLRVCAWLSGEKELVPDPLDRSRAERLLHENTYALLGPRPAERHVFIMVTAPDAEQVTPTWATEVIRAGADVLRINGAHESPTEWATIAATFKACAAAQGKRGCIFVDLPGPKLRTEIRTLEDVVLHLPRRKDHEGRTVAPTEVRLVDEYHDGPEVPVPAGWLAALKAGDTITFTDAAGRPRELTVRGGWGDVVRAECDRSLYLRSGLPLEWRRGDSVQGTGEIGMLPRQPRALELSPGDTFLLNASGESPDPSDNVLAFPEPALLEQVEPGERVILDDGKIVAVVHSRRPDGLVCTVQRTVKSPTRLRSGKGVAFPDSTLSLRTVGVSPQDEAALTFALEQADGVGVSFVNAPRDVAVIGERINTAGKSNFGMILKLETRGVLRNLPGILFEALKYHPVGLMIARGDLAVELSFERLAEIQEELLCFGEACHLPVIWATQVLDSAAQTGVPTRAEVTDAAMAMRAECVMLGKGPHIASATRMLADIIQKMEAHQFKRRSMMRPLAVALRHAM